MDHTALDRKTPEWVSFEQISCHECAIKITCFCRLFQLSEIK
jgi:hypothetical protein